MSNDSFHEEKQLTVALLLFAWQIMLLSLLMSRMEFWEGFALGTINLGVTLAFVWVNKEQVVHNKPFTQHLNSFKSKLDEENSVKNGN